MRDKRCYFMVEVNPMWKSTLKELCGVLGYDEKSIKYFIFCHGLEPLIELYIKKVLDQ